MMILLDICVIISMTLIGTVYLATGWSIFDKAGKPGWASFIPIYNLVLLIQMLGKPMWWLAMFLVPCLNFITLPVMSILVPIELGKRFGKGGGFIAGLILLPYLFFPLLAFGKAEYIPPETA